MAKRPWIDPMERASNKTLRLALRWMLILATALILAPPGGRRPNAFASGKPSARRRPTASGCSAISLLRLMAAE